MKNTRYDYYQPDIGRCWILVALFVCGALAGGIILALLKLIFPSSAILASQSLTYLLQFCVLAPVIYVEAGRRRQFADIEHNSPVPLDRPAVSKGKLLPYILAIALVTLALGIVLEPLTSIIPMPESVKKMFEEIFFGTNLTDAVISTCIFAPVCEEVLCRGIMLRGMAQHISPAKAIIWSSLIFAVIHMNPWQAIPAFVLGCFFGWVYWRTGSLWSTIALHCLNNSTAEALSRLIPNMGVDEGFIDLLPTCQYVLLYAGSLLITAGGIYLLNRIMPKKKTNE